MAHRPLIGVVPLWDDTLNSLWMLPGYFDGIIEAGGIPVMLPLTDDEAAIEQLVGQCDGFWSPAATTWIRNGMARRPAPRRSNYARPATGWRSA